MKIILGDFNVKLRERLFSKVWKDSIIVPIYKKGVEGDYSS